VIERALTLVKGGVVLPSDLPREVLEGAQVTPLAQGAGSAAEPLAQLAGDRPTLAELERRYIELILSETGGNKKRAAEILGIDRRTLYRTLDREKSAASPTSEDDE
jgi:DNA-binding NtrC family response regulator